MSANEQAPAPDYFHIAWYCVIEVEQIAAWYALDYQYSSSSDEYKQRYGIKGDDNTYLFGRISSYNVVITRFPGDGAVKAESGRRDLERTFWDIKYYLLVGVGGGVPYDDRKQLDIRLGDVVVSRSEKSHPGIVQFVYGKEEEGGFVPTGTILPPDNDLRKSADGLLQKFQPTGDGRLNFQRLVWEILDRCSVKENDHRWEYPGEDQDFLFDKDYSCVDHEYCPEKCDTAHLMRRAARPQKLQKLHGGLIASISSVIKRAAKRDELVSSCAQGNILCFEMEAFAIASEQRALTIKGVCDYSDSHKNKRWQPYAAVAAAAFAKSVVLGLDPLQPPAQRSPFSSNLQRASTYRSWFDNPSESERDDLIRRRTASFGLGIMGQSNEGDAPPFFERARLSLGGADEKPSLSLKRTRLRDSLGSASSSFNRYSSTAVSEKESDAEESRGSDSTHPVFDALPSWPNLEYIAKWACQTHHTQLDDNSFEDCLCTLHRIHIHGFSFPMKLLELEAQSQPGFRNIVWLPADNIAKSSKGAYEIYKWADCGQVHEQIHNGYSHYYFSYEPGKPNHELRLQFNSEEESKEFRELVLDLGLDINAHELLSDALSDAFDARLAVYGTRNDQKDTSPRRNADPLRFLLVRGPSDHQHSNSGSLQLLSISTELQLSILDIMQSQQPAHQIELSGLEVLHYTNPNYKRIRESLSELRSRGIPTEEQWVSTRSRDSQKRVSILLGLDDFTALLKHTVGWQSVYWGRVKSLQWREIMSRSLSSPFVIMGRRSNQGAQLLIYDLQNKQSNKDRLQWYIFELMEGLDKLEGNDQQLSLPIEHYTDVNSFTLRKLGLPLREAKSTKTLKIKFENRGDRNKFYEGIKIVFSTKKYSTSSLNPQATNVSG